MAAAALVGDDGVEVSLKVTPGSVLLEEERRRASFDVKALTELIEGSAEFTRAKVEISHLILDSSHEG